MKKKYILSLLFKNRKGLFQLKEYNKKAKEFWKRKKSELTEEITKTFRKASDEDLMKICDEFKEETGFSEFGCTKEEISEIRKVMREFGQDEVIKDFVEYGTRTGFLTMVIAPALAAAEGAGDVEKNVIDEWLYAIGICLPVSADICDSIMDKEVINHPSIPKKVWINIHKLGAAIIFYRAKKHMRRIKTNNKKLNKRIMERVKQGIKKVSEKQMMDLEVKKSAYVPLSKLEEIYDGKICEIEATVFGTLPSKKMNIVKTFEKGASFFAGEMQVVDDIEDLLGDANIGKKPEIPNPSFFLTYCFDLWNSGERNIKEIMKKAARKTLKKGEEYHRKVVEAYEKLPKKFPTRPFFDIILWYYNKVLKDRVKEFLKGKTFAVLEPQLKKILETKSNLNSV